MRLLPLLALGLLAACNPPSDELPATLPCDGRITAVPERLGIHEPQGTPITWESNPPATGAHYPVWAPWAQAFEQPVPRGNWVHNLEHGGVVLLARAPADVQALRTLGQSLSQDPLCAAPINARWLVTADPLLPEVVAVAASAWGWIYTASCLDEATLRVFIRQHYGQASEDTCADGAVGWQ